MLPSGNATCVSSVGEFGDFCCGQKVVMSAKIGSGDEFYSAWVCGRVTTVSEPVKVFGA
jgi:hypothetical protein